MSHSVRSRGDPTRHGGILGRVNSSPTTPSSSPAGTVDTAVDHRPDATADLTATAQVTNAEIRERMSGNLCRCGAYSNIAEAIAEVAGVPAAGRSA